MSAGAGASRQGWVSLRGEPGARPLGPRASRPSQRTRGVHQPAASTLDLRTKNTTFQPHARHTLCVVGEGALACPEIAFSGQENSFCHLRRWALLSVRSPGPPHNPGLAGGGPPGTARSQVAATVRSPGAHTAAAVAADGRGWGASIPGRQAFSTRGRGRGLLLASGNSDVR